MEMDFEKRIKQEVAGRASEEIDELILDRCPCTQLPAFKDEYVNLEKLSLVGCGLTTLKGFPNLPSLRKLDITDNKICDDDLAYLVNSCPALTHLSLGGNNIKDVSCLESLKKLEFLRKLDMLNCGASDADDYREKAFETLDQIIYLDGTDREEEEDEGDSEDDGEVDGLDAEDDEDIDGERDGEDGSDGEDRDCAPGDEDEEDEDDEDDDEEGDNDEPERGTKRKHEDEEDV